MPILPLDHPEPFAAVLGVMLYPGTDESEQCLARAFAAHYLAAPIRQYFAQGGTLARDDLLRIATDSGARLGNLELRWWQALATGEMFKVLFALAHTNEKLASWQNATRVAERMAATAKVAGSRSPFYEARRRYLSVAHLWAALCIRERRFSDIPEVGYDGWADFQSFLAEAEILRHWGQTWRPPRAKSEPPLPIIVWQVPADWSPPERQPGWPDTGRVSALTIDAAYLDDIRPPGRPRKLS